MKIRKTIYYAVVFAALRVLVACSGSNQQASDKGQQSNAAGAQASGSEAPAAATATSTAETTPTPPKTEPAATIPDFTFYKLNSGMPFVKQDLSLKGNIVFILFDPDCSHCQREAGMIGASYSKIKNAHLYFVSMMDPAVMDGFFDRYAKQLKDKDNVMMLYDRKAEFINKIHVPNQYPATYIYGKDGRLKEHWNGDRDIDDILASINKGS